MREPADAKQHAAPPTTRWSLIVAAAERGQNPEEAQRALHELCEMYWWPVLRFVLRKGYSLHDAQDLTQDFFARLSATEFLKQADPQKGRFRSLVFAALQHQLFDAADRLKAIKRGGAFKFTQLEEWMEESAITSDLASLAAGPDEHAFDHDWAALVVKKALKRLHSDYAARGKEREFALVRKFLTGTDHGTAYADAAAAMNIPVGTFKPMVRRMRVRYGVILREEVTQTISDLRDVDDEIRHLCQILASQPGLSAGTAS